eukprot:PhM_4_TR3046/c0_g1_i1/m.45574
MHTSHKNLSTLIRDSALTGQRAVCSSVRARADEEHDREYHGMPKLLSELRRDFQDRSCRKLLSTLHDLMSRILNEDDSRSEITACGGIDMLVSILLCDEEWFRGSMEAARSVSLRAWNTTLRIITELTVQDGSLPTYLYHTYPTLLTRVFWLLQFKTTFENGVIMCEHIVSAAGPMVVPKAGAEFLVSIIPNLNERTLALICRPMAMILNFSPILHTPDVDEVFTTAFVQRARCVHALLDRNERIFIDALRASTTMDKLVQLLRFELPSNAVSTQYGRTFALSMPVAQTPMQSLFGNDTEQQQQIMQQLVALLQQQGVSEFTMDDLMNSVGVQPGGPGGEWEDQPPDPFSLDWFCFIEEQLVLSTEGAEALASGFDHHKMFPSERSELLSPGNQDFAGHMAEEARALSIVSCQSEVLYVLSTLLTSRHYNDVWKLLYRTDIMQILSQLAINVFAIDRITPENQSPVADIDDDFHTHVPEVQRKIEFVRLVHELWDARGIADGWRQWDLGRLKAAKRPMLDIFVDHIVANKEDPCVRNLLCYSVESYLRGTLFANRVEEQVHVTDRLVPAIVEQISTAIKLVKGESLFALLGEVVRFSEYGLQALDKALSATPTTVSNFQSMMVAHPYDANLFLRSVILTLNDSFVWERYEPRHALGGRSYTDTFADFVQTILNVRNYLDSVDPALVPVDELMAKIEGCASVQPGDLKDTFDVDAAVLRSQRPCPHIMRKVMENKDVFSNVRAVSTPSECNVFGRLLYRMVLDVNLDNADSPDCICVITSSLLYFVLYEDQHEVLLEAMRKAIDPNDKEDPFRNLFDILCIWLARYTTRSADTLVYCTHIPMEHWRRVIHRLFSTLPGYFMQSHSALCAKKAAAVEKKKKCLKKAKQKSMTGEGNGENDKNKKKNKEKGKSGNGDDNDDASSWATTDEES